MKYRSIFSLISLMIILQSPAFAVTVRDVTYTTKDAGTVTFSHGSHIGKKAMANNCRACHDALFDLKKKKHYSMADMAKGKSCGACHDQKNSVTLKDCSRCHQTREMVYKVKETGPTGFSHKQHLVTSPDCGTCHPSLFAAGHNKHFTMADMAKGKSCGACHNGKKAFGVDACVKCHPVNELTYAVKETGPTHFSHTFHIEVAGCGSCHPKLYTPDKQNKRAGMAAMEKGKSCGACHNAKQAFPVKECAKCHPVRELLFEEKNAGNVVFSHKFHSGLYTCADCHTPVYQTTRSAVRVSMAEMEKGKSCGSCHEGKTAFSVKEKCESCHKM